MIIDIIVILFVAIGAVVGYKKGFINILSSIIALILALILAFLLQIPVANTLRQSSVGDKVKGSVTQGIQKAIDDKKTDFNNNTIYTTVVNGILTEDEVNTQAEKITLFILKGISFFIIFVIVFIIVIILKNILNIVFDLPILNSVNKFGGLGLGALKSLVIIYILLALITFVSPLPSVYSNLTQNIEKTNITKQLYNNNLLVNIIQSSIK